MYGKTSDMLTKNQCLSETDDSFLRVPEETGSFGAHSLSNLWERYRLSPGEVIKKAAFYSKGNVGLWL